MKNERRWSSHGNAGCLKKCDSPRLVSPQGRSSSSVGNPVCWSTGTTIVQRERVQ